MRRVFVTGIGTDVGKTVVSAILVEALRADYWKPVQAGGLDEPDSRRVRALISNPDSAIHPEQFRLRTPASPHAAAALDGVDIEVRAFRIPESSRSLVIEGAGGVLVPLNDHELMADLIRYLQAEVVLVARGYLGSINHTLLSIEALRARNIPLLGLVLNGEWSAPAREAVVQHGGALCLGAVNHEQRLDRECIRAYARSFAALPALASL
jgi:dethiobiotin synthetase